MKYLVYCLSLSCTALKTTLGPPYDQKCCRPPATTGDLLEEIIHIVVDLIVDHPPTHRRLMFNSRQVVGAQIACVMS